MEKEGNKLDLSPMNDPVDTKHSWLQQLGKRRDLVKTVVASLATWPAICCGNMLLATGSTSCVANTMMPNQDV